VHPHAHFGRTREAANLFEFLSACGAVQPSINSMKTDLAARRAQLLNARRKLARSVASGTKRRRRTVRLLARAIPERNHEEGGTDAVFQFQVALIEVAPEVFRQAQVDEWHFQGRSPVCQNVPQWNSAPQRIPQRTKNRAGEES
jgi:hypothetical protein